MTRRATPLNISIHQAVPGDLETLSAFNMAMALETENKALAPHSLNKGILAVLEHDDLGFYLVAKSNGANNKGQIAGTLMVTTEWSDWRNGLFWWIQSVYILPDFRRQGIFHSMYQEVKNRARKADNVCGLRLYVERENTRAQQTYIAMGMKETHYKLFEEEFQQKPNRRAQAS